MEAVSWVSLSAPSVGVGGRSVRQLLLFGRPTLEIGRGVDFGLTLVLNAKVHKAPFTSSGVFIGKDPHGLSDLSAKSLFIFIRSYSGRTSRTGRAAAEFSPRECSIMLAIPRT